MCQWCNLIRLFQHVCVGCLFLSVQLVMLEFRCTHVCPFACCDQWEQRVERSQEEFETISKQLRKELGRFDRQRCRDFRTSIVVYLESLMSTQQQVVFECSCSGSPPSAAALAASVDKHDRVKMYRL